MTKILPFKYKPYIFSELRLICRADLTGFANLLGLDYAENIE